MIKYTNISNLEYLNLPIEERTGKAYCIESHGNIYWLCNGLYHRENGPAIIREDRIFGWYLYGYPYIFEKWLEKTLLSDEEKVFLRIKYGN